MGMAGAEVDREVILVAGIAGLLAGAFSIAAGEYASMRFNGSCSSYSFTSRPSEIGSDGAPG
jgi:vacuolar iron transporter family protein